MTTLRLVALAAFLLALVFAGQGLYRAGYEAAMASIARDMAVAQKAAFDAAELASRKEADRLAAEAARADLARQLETAAYEDADADRVCLGPDSVRRLKAR